MKKRPRRMPSNSPIARRRTAPPEPVVLHYKVVELSTVDEATLEETVNGWVHQGWTVESVHFAMRESSKRPAMAFLFFTRARLAAAPDVEAARARLQRLAHGAGTPSQSSPSTAWERLAQLAGSGERET
jgi:hypothetical protein